MRICAHCGTEFEPTRPHNVYCSKLCTMQHNNVKWRENHPHRREHHAWRDLRRRCTNPNHEDYPRYGARGITVCERWDSFENFFADMGPKPSPTHSIDRINNNGNYEPSNCRWATKTEQARNRRPFSEWNLPKRRSLATSPHERQES